MRRILLSLSTAALLAAPAAAQGRVADGWLGISWRPAGDAMVVTDVFPGSPADRAGVEPGDTVLRWNGDAAAATAQQARPLPGDTVQLRLRRGTERDRDVVVVAGPRPPRFGARSIDLEPLVRGLRFHADSLRVHADSLHQRLRVILLDSLGHRFRELERENVPYLRDFSFDFELGARSVAGAEFAEMNPGLADYFQTPSGALVLRVAPDTPAARAGLAPGDVVVRAGDDEVASVADLRRALQRRGRGPGLELEVVRRGERVVLRMGR